MLALGVDPGLAKCGLAVVRVDRRDNFEIVDLRCSVTQKANKKLNRLAREDLVMRGEAVHEAMVEMFHRFEPSLVCAESISYPRSSIASMQMGICWGVLLSVCSRFDTPLIHTSPQEIKDAMTGKKSASKAEMIERVQGMDVQCEWPKATTLHEHCADAVGAVYAQRDSPIFRAFR